MKIIFFSLLLICAEQLEAQATVEVQKAAMADLFNMAGDWFGKAWYINRETRIDIHQTEHVEIKLDSTILVIEGTGRVDGEVRFQALAVISYDIRNNVYRLQSYLADGKSTSATGYFNDDGLFEWGFDLPGQGHISYKIDLSDNSWEESGSFSPDTTHHYTFYGSILTRKHN